MSSNTDDDNDDDSRHDTLTQSPISEQHAQHQQQPSITATNVPVVACALLASLTTGGTTYSFSLIGNELKHSLGLTQSQLDTISAVFFLSGLLSFIPGGFADRFGTRFGISVGGVTGCVSLILYWVVSKGFIPFISNNPPLVVGVLSFVGVGVFLSCACVTGSVFKIISCQCGPGSKGSAVGVAKGYVGLGSGVYAALYQAIRSPSMSDLDFLCLAAFFFIVAASVPSFLTLPNLYKETHERLPDVFTPLHFRLLYGSLLLLAVIIIVTSLEELYEDEHHNSQGNDLEATTKSSPNYTLAFTIILVWLGPIALQVYLPQRSNPYIPAETIDNDNHHDHRSDATPDDVDIDLSHDEIEHETLLEQRHSNGADLNTSSDNDHNLPTTTSPRSRARKRMIHSEPNPPPRHTDSEENIVSMGIALDTVGQSSQDNQEDLPMEALPQDELLDGHNDDDDDEETPAMLSNRDNGLFTNERHDKNLYEMLQTPTAWLLVWTGTIIAGGGTVETNNLGQMCESLGFDPVVTPAALALFSVAQSGGRVITGALSEAALTADTSRCCIDRGIPRPFFFSAASVMSVLAHSILAVATAEAPFILGITLSGFAFGMIWPLMVLCVGEIFGTAHVGANYMFYDGFTSAAGTFLLAKVVAQQVYESHIDPHSSASGEDNANTCIGQDCFRMTHIVIVVLSLTCLGTSLILQSKTAPLYNKGGSSIRSG